MNKTTRTDRKRGPRREPSEFMEETLSVDRVTRVVKGGRRLRFRAVVIVGNKKGKVGLGTGKANEVQVAVQKAVKVAKANMIRIPLIKGTIPHEVDVKHKAARLRLLPASEGTGVLAGGALRVVLEFAGVKDVLSKRFGTTNKLVNAQAAMQALEALRSVNRKGETVGMQEEKIATPLSDAEVDENEKEGLKITEVSKKDIQKGHVVANPSSGSGQKAAKKDDKKPAAKKPAPEKKEEKKD